jgi:hypothetical protein
MNRRVAARLAWSLWALSMVLTILSLWLLVLNSSHSDVPVYTFWAENVLFSVGFSTVGAVIVPRMPPENSIGWLFCAVGLLCEKDPESLLGHPEGRDGPRQARRGPREGGRRDDAARSRGPVVAARERGQDQGSLVERTLTGSGMRGEKH